MVNIMYHKMYSTMYMYTYIVRVRTSADAVLHFESVVTDARVLLGDRRQNALLVGFARQVVTIWKQAGEIHML